MITASEIYWILKLDSILILLGVLCGASAIFILGSLIWILVENDGYRPNEDNILYCKKNIKKTIPLTIILGLFTTFIPSTKQMAAIKIIPLIANSEIVGELSADAKELYRMGINAIKEQLTGNNKEQDK